MTSVTPSAHLTVPSHTRPALLASSSAASGSSSAGRPSAFDPVPYESIPQQAWDALEHYKQADTANKVVVRFKATGNAPIMKQNYFKITASHKFDFLVSYLRKQLGWKPSDPLFLYVNSSFSPPPDDSIGTLHKCFATEGHLIVNYSSTPAWA